MQKTEWSGLQCPPLYTERLNGGQRQITVYADPQEPQSEDGSTQWTATAITLPVGVYDYGSIVSAVINARYSGDQMQAIINNHLIDSHEGEFNAMQEYRLYAKRVAKEIIEDMDNK